MQRNNTYDANGNLTGKTADGHAWAYEWNAENQLLRVTKDGAEVARYAYDPLGRRVEKVEAGKTTAYTYAEEDILRAVADGATVRYVHGPGIDEPLASVSATGQLSVHHADALGSIIRLTSTSGVVTTSRSYEASGTPGDGTATAGYAYTGREWDTATGLYYYRARHYASQAGRFVSSDPIGLQGGLNLFAYVDNSPIVLVDPFGLLSPGQAVGATLPVAVSLAAADGPLPFGDAAAAVLIGGAAAAGAAAMVWELVTDADSAEPSATSTSGSSTTPRRSIAQPCKPRRGCTRTCRADANNRMPGNISRACHCLLSPQSRLRTAPMRRKKPNELLPTRSQ